MTNGSGYSKHTHLHFFFGKKSRDTSFSRKAGLASTVAWRSCDWTVNWFWCSIFALVLKDTVSCRGFFTHFFYFGMPTKRLWVDSTLKSLPLVLLLFYSKYWSLTPRFRVSKMSTCTAVNQSFSTCAVHGETICNDARDDTPLTGKVKTHLVLQRLTQSHSLSFT